MTLEQSKEKKNLQRLYYIDKEMYLPPQFPEHSHKEKQSSLAYVLSSEGQS